MNIIRNWVLGLVSGIFLAGAASSEMHEETVLTVSGLGDPITYSRAALAELGADVIETKTIWTEGVHRFTGVSLLSFVEALGIEKGVLKAMAINDYAVEIPLSDAVEDGPIIAYEMDGEPMSVRERGPLWVVYPYDSNPDYRSEVIHSRSIWQMDRIDVIE